MKQLSSRSTFLYKRLFPGFWFGFLGLFIVLPYLDHSHGARPAPFPFMVIPVLMGVMGYLFMKHTMFDLIDSVFDDGTSLLFRNSGHEVRIDLRDIKNISYATVMNPPRVTVSVRQDTPLGKDLSFMPQASWVPFRKNRDIVELIERIDQRRANQAL